MDRLRSVYRLPLTVEVRADKDIGDAADQSTPLATCHLSFAALKLDMFGSQHGRNLFDA